MAQSYRLSPPVSPRRRRRRLIVWAAVACVAAVLIEVGAVTDLFGFGWFGKSGTSTPSPPPNPNPYDENITSVLGSIAYSGSGTDPFPILNGGQLCPACPIAPKEDTSVDPPVASVWVYFNVTYTGTNDTTISNFTLSTSGSDPGLFELLGVFAPPAFGETVTLVTFWSGHATWELAFHASASSIPNDGSAGYQLTLHVTSP